MRPDRQLDAGAAAAPRRRGGQAGFTLVELAVVVVVVAAIGIMVTAFSLSAVNTASGAAKEQQLDASTAELVAMTFGRDVQGAARLTASHCGSGGQPLVSLASSDTPSRTTTYRAVPDGGTTTLTRTTCTGATQDGDQLVAEGLAVAPTVTCDDVACDAAARPTPRTVALRTGRRDVLPFRLRASRRPTAGPDAPPPLTARLFALGGSTPLAVTGNGSLTVDGDAYVNSASSSAVSMGGNARLAVTGTFRIRQGGGCSGCNATRVTPFPPGSFPAALPDPLGQLPAPSEAGLANGSCNATRCTPGLYRNVLAISGGSVELQPGTYVLRRGLSVSGSAVVTGSGVLLFNGCGQGAPAGCATSQGAVAISGQGSVQLSPPTTGMYRGVLLFQSRSNAAASSISGGALASAYDGVLYSPSGSFTLGAGGGGLRLGAVIGSSLTVAGNGAVTIDG